MKTEKDNSSGNFKILNSNNQDSRSLAKAKGGSSAGIPQSPVKHVSINKTKLTPPKAKRMDHYVIKEANEDDGETIDLILAELDDPKQNGGGNNQTDVEITEDLRLSVEDEEHDGKNDEAIEHVCAKCFKSFRRFNGLKKHLDFCRFDSGYHLRKAEMLKNLEKIEKDSVKMENKDICFCCEESYDTYHLGHINCPDCPKSFKSQVSYERHIFITHAEIDDFPCTVCNAKLRSANLLKLHIDQHQNRGKPFACKVCGRDFTRSYHLKRHQKYSTCSGKEVDSMNCKVCNKAFYRLDNLRAHLKQHLGTYVTKKPEYMCPICKNCFYSLSTLNIHTRTHTGERPFECDLCDKKFPSLVSLKKHRRYHTGEKPYTCSVCNQSFAVKEVLNRHMKRHTGERPHVCQECGKSFIQATQLRNHSKTHIRPFECLDCDEKFKTEKQLERHAKIHSSKRLRKSSALKCGVCKTSFKTAEELKEHVEKENHTRTAPKRKLRERTDCAICEKNFDSAKSLGQHMLDVHEVDPAVINGEKPLTPNLDDGNQSKILKLQNMKFDDIEIITSDGNYKMATPIEEQNQSTIVEEILVDEMPVGSEKGTILLHGDTVYTVIPLEQDDDPVPSRNKSVSNDIRKEQRKSLGASLAAAIADEPNDEVELIELDNLEDIKLKENVRKLLDMLVDAATLKQFSWPKASVEEVLCKVIENCGHDLSKDSEVYKNCDYATRMREYVKLLFTVVIHNDSIKELLNNYPIDEVIEYVLGNDGDDDDEDDDGNAGAGVATGVDAININNNGYEERSIDSKNDIKKEDRTPVTSSA